MWFKIKDQEVEISIRAKPNAKKSAVLKVEDDALYISIHAEPQEGKANKELIVFCSKLFNIPKSKIILKKGTGSRYKVISLPLTENLKQTLEQPEKLIIG